MKVVGFPILYPLSRAFGLDIVAEGVETPEQGRMLLQLGYERAQGYVIGRPMPAEAIPGWVAEWRPHPSWWPVRTLPTSEYLLLRAQVALQRTLCRVDAFLQEPESTLPEIPALAAHVEPVFRARENWPNRQDELDRLAAIERRLDRLIGELARLEFNSIINERERFTGEVRDLEGALETCRRKLH